MMMDRFEIFRFHAIPIHEWMLFEAGCNISSQIFNKHGLIVSSLGHCLFIRTFQAGIQFTTCRTFRELDQFFKRELLGALDRNRYEAALVMRTAFADRF